ncbi:eCIS core domain-containing protein [Larkinella sp. GY13]|uniref:eCIS core domain-containing protein n=1 Tax=Larkinella sp. GY13 TaxID=3453720 RepID=UPI003EECF524
MKATRQHQPLLQPKTTSSSSNHATTSQPFFAKTGTPSQSQPEPFFKSLVQTKLTVGRSDDRFEREADATADRVMRMPAPHPSNRPFFPASGLLQPKSDEKEKKDVLRKEADTDMPVIQLKTDEEDKKKIRKKGDSAPPAVTGGFESQLSASQSGGQPLSADTRQFMEPRFGADFSGVRVHTDAPAVQMSQSIGAQAFAYQNHVYFNEGKYSPGTRSGQHLLAHELTHVVQQGAAVQRKPLISSATPAVQRLFGLDVAGTIDGWLANLPGWRLLTVLAGYNPVLQREVPRSTTNLIEGFLTLGGPIGLLLFNKLRTEGIIGRMADWIDTQVAALGISYAYIRGLFSQAWDDMGITLGISGNLDIIRRVFAPPFNRITAFVGRVINQVVVFIKETIVRPLSTRARQMRGFTLLTVIIGKDPFTDEVVERSPTNLVRGFMSLMENGDERFQQMKQSGALQRAFTWFNVETTRRNLTWERIKGIFTAVWNALTPEAVLHPLEIISRIAGLFFGLAADIAGFAGAALLQMLEFIFEAVMGAGGARVLAILKRARATFLIIIRDPVRFVGNLVRAGVQGFRQFMQNALTHLQRGLVGWLLGALEGAGLTLPQTFDLQGILSLVLQILGLTYQNIRAKLVRATSEQFVSRMEQVFDFLRILITQGPAAAWQKIVEYLGNLRNMVLDGVIAWVRQTVIGQAIIRIASMLNPAGAVIQAIMATYNTVMFFVERINQIAAVVESYVDSMAAIAAGNIAAAANRVETTMGRMVPVIISFLARLMGLGGISNTIRTTIARIRQPVDRALDRVVDWVVAQGRRLVGAVVGVGQRVAQWWRNRSQFRDVNDETHTVYFEGEGTGAQLILASNPTHIGGWIRNRRDDLTNTGQMTDAKRSALRTIEQLVTELRGITYPIAGAPAPRDVAVIIRELTTNIGAVGVQGSPPVPRMVVSPGFADGYRTEGEMQVRYLFNDHNNHERGTPTRTSMTLMGAFPHLETLGLARGGRWIRGHLLNRELGGKAVDSNLVPIPSALNRQQETGVDDALKTEYGDTVAKKVFWLDISVTRGHSDKRFISQYSVLGGRMRKNENGTGWIKGQQIGRFDSGTIDMPSALPPSSKSVTSLRGTPAIRADYRSVASSNNLPENLIAAITRSTAPITNHTELENFITTQYASEIARRDNYLRIFTNAKPTITY